MSKIKRFYKLFTNDVRDRYTKSIWVNVYLFAIDSENEIDKLVLFNFFRSLGFLKLKKDKGIKKKKLENVSIFIKRTLGKYRQKPVVLTDPKYEKAMPIELFLNILKSDKHLYKKYLRITKRVKLSVNFNN